MTILIKFMKQCLSNWTPCLLGRYSLRVRQNEEVVDGQAVAEGGEVCIQYFSNAFFFVFINRFVQYDASNSRSAKRKGGLFLAVCG